MAGALTRSPSIVDDSPKDLKQRGCPMDLVDHNQLTYLSTQERICVPQATLVGRAFQIEVHSRGLRSPGRNRSSQCGLSDLPWT